MEQMPARSKPAFSSYPALLGAGIAAIFASACCLALLILPLLGFSGAWMGHLTALEPYRPFFIGVAVLALLLASRRIWQPVGDCQPSTVCAQPQVRLSYQWLFGLVVLLVTIAVDFPYITLLFY